MKMNGCVVNRRLIDCSLENAAIEMAKQRHGIEETDFNEINVYCYNVIVPIEYGEKKTTAFANDVFHAVGVLDDDEEICVEEGTQYCEFVRDDKMGCYCVIFNHHDVVGSEPGDEMFEYSVESLREDDGDSSRNTLNGSTDDESQDDEFKEWEQNSGRVDKVSVGVSKESISDRKPASDSVARSARNRMTNTQIRDFVKTIFDKYGIVFKLMGVRGNRYVYNAVVVGGANEMSCVIAFNELFSGLGLLPPKCFMMANQILDYCAIVIKGKVCCALFNNPIVLDFKPGDDKYRYLVKFMKR